MLVQPHIDTIYIFVRLEHGLAPYTYLCSSHVQYTCNKTCILYIKQNMYNTHTAKHVN